MATLRKARLADARKLSGIAEATFRAAFGAVNAPEPMQRHCETSYAEWIQARDMQSRDGHAGK